MSILCQLPKIDPLTQAEIFLDAQGFERISKDSHRYRIPVYRKSCSSRAGYLCIKLGFDSSGELSVKCDFMNGIEVIFIVSWFSIKGAWQIVHKWLDHHQYLLCELDFC